MCKKRIGQLLALSLLALGVTACGQKGDLFLPESEQAEAISPEKEAPDDQNPKDGPIMESEPQDSEKVQESAESQGDKP